MATIKHVAVASHDPAGTAAFFKNVFGFKEMRVLDAPSYAAHILTDGGINFAVIDFKNDAGAGKEKGKGFKGYHHIGLHVEDEKEACRRVEAAGATPRPDISGALGLPAEFKYTGPEGLLFDINVQGWAGTSDATDGPRTIRHIAIATKDADRMSKFFLEAFGMRRVRTTDRKTHYGHIHSDGSTNVALLDFHEDGPAGVEYGRLFTGYHHIGLQVPQADEAHRRLAAAGAAPRSDINQSLGMGSKVEFKYAGPEGLLFDVSEVGWDGYGGR